MPDDDYEEVTIGCSHSHQIVPPEMEKKKEIKKLLGMMEHDFNVKFHPDVRNAFWYIHKIIQILRIMNGIE